MKTKFLHIATALLFAGFTSSCSDFLDRYPLDELSDSSFWKTENDAMMAVTDIYGCLPTWDQDEDINSDNAVHGIKWAAGNISKGIYDPMDQSWAGSYTPIRQCNLVLEKVKDIEMSDESRKKIEGQAYFFRAFVYFNLIRSFGDVPYIDKPLNLTDVEDITRTPREEVYAKVMADFDKAIEYLPEEWDAANTPRVTKGAALAMKARAALYYNNWQVAADASKAVMDLGKYELYDAGNTGKYQELFWEKSMIRCAISTLSPSMLITTVRPFNKVSVISISSSMVVGLITHTSIPGCPCRRFRLIGVILFCCFCLCFSEISKVAAVCCCSSSFLRSLREGFFSFTS